MGEVYRARDERLGRDVAVKILPPALATSPDMVKRFDREARAASALGHPGIVTVHDVGEAEGVPYLVTELLDGETLHDRLRRGPLPASEARALGAQVATALAAAHERGIVHRDIKPANVFLTRDGTAKLLDFGLATALAGDTPEALADTATTALTRPGMLLGTPAYMAPEQARGERCDARTDIHALGVVLHESVTGHNPFTRATVADTLAAILTEELPDPGSGASRADPELARVIAHCLEKRPTDRFQSARDLAYELRRTPMGGRGAPPRRRRFAVAVALAVVVVAAAAALRFPRGRPAGDRPALDPRRTVVAVFENLTGEPALDPLGRIASDWITQGLSRVERMSVVPSTSVLYATMGRAADPAPDADPLRALAEATGAGTVVSGSFHRDGRKLRFQAQITDAVDRRVRQPLAPVSAPADSPMAAIDALRQQATGALAARFEPEHDLAEQIGAPLYDAYREFIAGFELFGTDDAEALRHFLRAADLDTTFSAPLMYAAFIHDLAGDRASGAAMLARCVARRQSLSPWARTWLDALLAYREHRYPAALGHLRMARAMAPLDPLATHWTGMLARMCNRPRETVAVYAAQGQRPWGGHPLASSWTSNHCWALHMLGEHERELAEARAVREQNPGLPWLLVYEMRALAALGDLGAVARLAAAGISTPGAGEVPGHLLLTAAVELRVHGLREASLEFAGQAADWFAQRLQTEPGSLEWRSGLVGALRQAERWPEALATCDTTRIRDPEMLARSVGIRGALLLRCGRPAETARADRMLALMDPRAAFGEHTFRRACLAALRGERAGAVALLRQAFAEGLPHGSQVHGEIDLEPLWQDAGFRELLRPEG